MASIAPGLDGYLAAQQMAQQREAQQVGILSRLAQIKMQQDQAAQAAEMRPLQMEVLRGNIAKQRADQEALAGQRTAQIKLSDLMANGGSQIPADSVALTDAEALRRVQEADAQGKTMTVNVPNPSEVRRLSALAFPAEFGKAQSQALFREPKVQTPRQSIIPVTGGYLAPDEAGRMVFTRTQAEGTRAEPAPVVKDIIDPSNPNRLISIDVRKYRGGSLGAEGVIGVAGKEPTAQKKSEQLDVGRDMVNSTVVNLKSYYDQLNEGGGIVNQDRGALANIGSRLGASAIGQTVGGAVGTKNQNIRDSIEQQRPLLLRAIMQATGMSARQLDSNAELKLWLATATDPTKGYQANMDALNNIAEMFGKGGFMPKGVTKPITGPSGAPVAQQPPAGGGVRFLGFEDAQSR